jgi:mannose-6-phosphate isomerase
MPFPLCARLLETGDRQPLCVHPARDVRAGETDFLANTKFWFSIDRGAEARILVGLQHGATQQQFRERLGSQELEDLLQGYRPRSTDAFYVPAGCLHALGGGNLVWELQLRPAQSLRITTWGSDPEPPEWEQQAALAAVNFQDRQVRRISTEATRQPYTRKVPLLPHCPQFFVEEIRLVDHLFDGTGGRLMHLLFARRGGFRLVAGEVEITVRQGMVVCIPAAAGDYRLYADEGRAGILRAAQQTLR